MRWITATVLLLAGLSCGAQQDGGGREVSVRLFSAHPPESVVVTAAGPGAWWAVCANCTHQPLTTALHLPGVREIVAGGPVTVSDAEHAQVRTSNGKWHLRAGHGSLVEVLLTLPSERYVAAVLMGEAAADEPAESLRALAVVARTLALRGTDGNGSAGQLPRDICDSTACQAMKFGPVSRAVREAVRSTAGETVWFGSARAHIFFSGSCGGTREAAGAIWPELSHVSYLRSIADPYCVRKDRAAWHGELPLATAKDIVLHEGWRVPHRILAAQVSERTLSQRARTILFTGDKGERATVSASAFRIAVGRSLGWNVLRSDAYDLRIRDGLLVFDGRGHGHGVGLCQQGATEMARLGKSYREIVGFYFPGTTVRVMQSDEGWKQSSQDGIHFNSTIPLAPGLMDQATKAWRLAKTRFSVRENVTPFVTFSPTTELFRQITSQPGWQLASTSGSEVVLQPASVIAANRLSVQTTLLHEMLHVAVEAAAHTKAPLWLREGLVEVLAGDPIPSAPLLSAEETDRLLQTAATWLASRTAHAAAGARTRRLVERYGLSAVRGWLVEGSTVPSE